MSKKILRETFTKAFDFLWNEFGFVVINDKKENWGYTLEAKSKNVGIRIIYEYREAFVNVILYKLTDGNIIENTTQAILNNQSINGFSIDYIVEFINPNDLQKTYYPKQADVDEENDLENYVLDVARKTKKYGQDVLRGDFSIFEKLDSIVKDKYANYYKGRNK